MTTLTQTTGFFNPQGSPPIDMADFATRANCDLLSEKEAVVIGTQAINIARRFVPDLIQSLQDIHTDTLFMSIVRGPYALREPITIQGGTIQPPESVTMQTRERALELVQNYLESLGLKTGTIEINESRPVPGSGGIYRAPVLQLGVLAASNVSS